MALEFWHGLDGPGEKKCDLTIASVSNPDCMALDDLGSVYIVSSVAADVMCEKLSPDDDYAAPTDLTEGLDTSTGIKAIEAIDSQ